MKNMKQKQKQKHIIQANWCHLFNNKMNECEHKKLEYTQRLEWKR